MYLASGVQRLFENIPVQPRLQVKLYKERSLEYTTQYLLSCRYTHVSARPLGKLRYFLRKYRKIKKGLPEICFTTRMQNNIHNLKYASSELLDATKIVLQISELAYHLKATADAAACLWMTVCYNLRQRVSPKLSKNLIRLILLISQDISACLD